MFHNRNGPHGMLGNRSGTPAGARKVGNCRTGHDGASQNLAGKCLAGQRVVRLAGEIPFGDVDGGRDRGGGLHDGAVVRLNGNSGDARERS